MCLNSELTGLIDHLAMPCLLTYNNPVFTVIMFFSFFSPNIISQYDLIECNSSPVTGGL